MRPAVKAFLLSALVFPGLGQLYKQDRTKGVLLILLANLILALTALAGIMVLAEEYMTAVYPEALSVDTLRVLLLRVFSRPLVYVPTGLLFCLWSFAAADAALSPIPPREET